jgi:hypothetical protein
MAARFAVTVVLALVALAAGCGGDEGGDDPADVIAESAERTGEIESFHFTLDVQNVPITTSGLQITSAEGDVAVPDRASADVTGNFAGVSLTTQVIAIGDDVWLLDPLTKKWTMIDVSTTPIALLDPTEGILGVMAGVENATDAGTEKVGDVTVRKITGTADTAAVAPLVATSASEGEVPVALYIGEDDLLLRRVDVTGPVAEGEADDSLRTFEISRFDEPVEIEPPEESG